ncbi:DUF3789 domain-containing protein [Ruminococcus sp.]|nr:DUF3789 domain-containing protein [Ruminococcus sp.]
MIRFILGGFIGYCIGIFVMCFCQADEKGSNVD